MAGKAEFYNQTEKQSECRVVPSQGVVLRELDARLRNLSDRLAIFHAPSETLDPALGLRVKVDAARWMLRVARHTESPALERILITIQNCLDQLEKAVAQRPHAA